VVTIPISIFKYSIATTIVTAIAIVVIG